MAKERKLFVKIFGLTLVKGALAAAGTFFDGRGALTIWTMVRRSSWTSHIRWAE
jgi:hypothetical protein